jgi:hypothetical protein
MCIMAIAVNPAIKRRSWWMVERVGTKGGAYMTFGSVLIWVMGLAVLWTVAWVRRFRLGVGDVVFLAAGVVAIAVVVMVWPLG